MPTLIGGDRAVLWVAFKVRIGFLRTDIVDLLGVDDSEALDRSLTDNVSSNRLVPVSLRVSDSFVVSTLLSGGSSSRILLVGDDVGHSLDDIGASDSEISPLIISIDLELD